MTTQPRMMLRGTASAEIGRGSGRARMYHAGIRDYKVTGVQTCALPIYQAENDAEEGGIEGEEEAGAEGDAEQPGGGEADDVAAVDGSPDGNAAEQDGDDDPAQDDAERYRLGGDRKRVGEGKDVSRRHTRLQGDWSSDVCSSDLSGRE